MRDFRERIKGLEIQQLEVKKKPCAIVSYVILNKNNLTIFAAKVLYCTVLYCTVWYCTYSENLTGFRELILKKTLQKSF